MSDIDIRITGRAGRITLTRPQALNAMTYDMCLAIEAALDDWAGNDAVALVVIDAEGERAFCSGGDIAELYETGTRGDYAYGRRFWADEYRLNNKIFGYDKPVVSFLQGFTMGGGVGIGCHGSHRVVGESSQIAMPECGIGLVPDVGGTLILARAPGRLGEYLGTTATRLGPDDAIFAGFADVFLPEASWPEVVAKLETTGDPSEIKGETPPPGSLRDQLAEIDRHFSGADLEAVLDSLQTADTDFAKDTLKKLSRVSPLSAACTIEIIHRLRDTGPTMANALDLEYRFTYRAMEDGDFLEGIRAAIIDKDRNPRWQHAGGQVPPAAISHMLQPLGADAVKL
ncbi:enoyl-CoA hydratase [Sulfitobacter porphyrae]|nr:enoyl-CoA hydratase [Sulfitobacter porphyrae]